jgi:hypothetical protein
MTRPNQCLVGLGTKPKFGDRIILVALWEEDSVEVQGGRL